MDNPPPPTPPSATPAGWFPDPLGRYEHRYFNGVTWTSDVSDGGQRLVDPLGTGPGYPSGRHAGNGLATAAVTCGAIGALIAWVPFVVVFGVVLGILALVFGIKGLRRSRIVGSGRGMAIAGIISGILTLLLAVVGVVLSVIVFRAVADFAEPGPVSTVVTSCTLDGRTATVEGTLTNDGRTMHSYSLFVTVDGQVDAITIDDVPAGGSIDWSTIVRTRGVLDECGPTLVVQGPFPFGIEIDPVTS